MGSNPTAGTETLRRSHGCTPSCDRLSSIIDECAVARLEGGDDERAEHVEAEVRRYYTEAAVAAGRGLAACCGPEAEQFGAGLYDDVVGLPEAAALASIGCGNPVAVADLHPGEVVLDLGSGGGIDVLLSARRVGPTGRPTESTSHPRCSSWPVATPPKGERRNVEFLEGRIDAVPLPDESVDVIISNCVINLAVDKPAVFAEMHRLLRPGGRIGISDVVTEDRLSAAERAERGSYVGCIAGALPLSDYRNGLGAAGLVDRVDRVHPRRRRRSPRRHRARRQARAVNTPDRLGKDRRRRR